MNTHVASRLRTFAVRPAFRALGGRRRRGLASAALALTAAVGGAGLPATAQAAPGDGALTVRVIQEYNGNGAWDSLLEPGISGGAVTVTDGWTASIA